MNTLRKYIFAFTAALVCVCQASVTDSITIPSVQIQNLSVKQDKDNISVSMDIDASTLRLGASREIIVRPVISDSAGNHTELPAVYFTGRSRYHLHLRDADIDAPDILLLAKDADTIKYSATAPYQQWMQQSSLNMLYNLCGCACAPIDSTVTPITQLDFTPITFTPAFVTVTPETETVKTREIKGSAYIDFPVNRVNLYPNYRRNPEEIARIRTSIDVVRNDPDASITSITIKGFASPEGPYSNNVRLAKGRTKTLRDYVQGLYSFDPSIMHTDWEAEDWAGLRNFVEKSNIEKRTAILTVIDSNLQPDAKDLKLRSDFKEEYAFLLENVYPALRHSDYTVEYVVRTFTDINEIAAVMKTKPNKLSLNELFLLSQSLDPTSEDYSEVFELAVRMFPNDSIANLNAAIINMRRGDYNHAKRFLERAGDSTQATYARGIMQALDKEYEEAAQTLSPIAGEMTEAADAMTQIRKILNRLSKSEQ